MALKVSNTALMLLIYKGPLATLREKQLRLRNCSVTRMMLLQTPLDPWLDLVTQPHFTYSRDLWVEHRIKTRQLN